MLTQLSRAQNLNRLGLEVADRERRYIRLAQLVCAVPPYHGRLRIYPISPRARSPLVPEATLDSPADRKQAIHYRIKERVFQSGKRTGRRGSHVD